MSDKGLYYNQPSDLEILSSSGIRAPQVDGVAELEEFVMDTSISSPEPVDSVITDFVQALAESDSGKEYMHNAVIVLGFVKGLGGKVLDSDSSQYLDCYLGNKPGRKYNYAAITTVNHVMTLKNDGSAFWFNYQPMFGEDAGKSPLLSMYSSQIYSALSEFLKMAMFQPAGGNPDYPLGSSGMGNILRGIASPNLSVNINVPSEGEMTFVFRDTVNDAYRKLYRVYVDDMVVQEPITVVMNDTSRSDGKYNIDLFIKIDPKK